MMRGLLIVLLLAGCAGTPVPASKPSNILTPKGDMSEQPWGYEDYCKKYYDALECGGTQ